MTPRFPLHDPAEPLKSPFARTLDIQFVEAAEGRALLRMPIMEKHLQNRRRVQGGIIAVLADVALYVALKTIMKPQEDSVTVEMKINFTRPAGGRELVCEATVAHRGRTIAVGDMLVKDEAGKLVAKATGTYMIVPRKTLAPSSGDEGQPTLLSPG